MGLASSIIKAADNLIETFGNDSVIYDYALASKQENEEGDIKVTDWKLGVTVKVIDGGNQAIEEMRSNIGFVALGEDQKIIKSSVRVAVNDRLCYRGKNYRISKLGSEIIESQDIIQMITCSLVNSISQW